MSAPTLCECGHAFAQHGLKGCMTWLGRGTFGGGTLCLCEKPDPSDPRLAAPVPPAAPRPEGATCVDCLAVLVEVGASRPDCWWCPNATCVQYHVWRYPAHVNHDARAQVPPTDGQRAAHWKERAMRAEATLHAIRATSAHPAPTPADALREAAALLSEFVDDEVCQYDHHGNCQTHSLGERPCEHERARAFLAALASDGAQ